MNDLNSTLLIQKTCRKWLEWLRKKLVFLTYTEKTEVGQLR